MSDPVTVRILVEVEVNAQGLVLSSHNFASPEDEQKATSLKGGGVRHIAHGLLTEAVRREAFVCALIAMSQNEAFLATYRAATSEEKRAVEAELAKRVELSLTGTVPKLTDGSAREVMEMLSSQV